MSRRLEARTQNVAVQMADIDEHGPLPVSEKFWASFAIMARVVSVSANADGSPDDGAPVYSLESRRWVGPVQCL